MAFEALGRLEDQMDALRSKVAYRRDRKLRNRIFRFSAEVYDAIELAFGDLQTLFSEIINTPRSALNETFVAGLRTKLDLVQSSDRFKLILKVCDQLDALAKEYRADIDRVLVRRDGKNFNELFYLLEKNESLFKQTIRQAIHEVAFELGKYRQGDDIESARALAAQARSDLALHMDRVSKAKAALAGNVGGIDSLLDVEADNVLRNSPWFTGSFYLAVVIVLFGILSMVAGQFDVARFAMIVVGTYVGLTLIGAFQLKNDDKLSENGFLELVSLAMTRVLLPIFKPRRSTG
jgi:hypothetical protein